MERWWKMNEVEPLIRRELQWMAQGVFENKDLAAIVIARSRRRRVKRVLAYALASLAIAFVSILAFSLINGFSNSADKAIVTSGDTSKISENTDPQSAQIQGLISDYPLTWEQSVGDLSAISKSAGIGDSLGGLTAEGLKVSWSSCQEGACPTEWTLSLINNTGDIISVEPSLMVYVDHSPLVSASRPVSVIPGARSTLVFTFPELEQGIAFRKSATWQWNWFLTVAR